MPNDDYTANTRGARRYRFDEEVRRKRAARFRRSEPRFLMLWLLIAVAAAATVWMLV